MNKEKFEEKASQQALPVMIEFKDQVFPLLFEKQTPYACLTFSKEAIELNDINPITNKKGQAFGGWTYPDIKRIEFLSVPKSFGVVIGNQGVPNNLGLKIIFKNGNVYGVECEDMNVAPLLIDFLPEHGIEVADRLFDK